MFVYNHPRLQLLFNTVIFSELQSLSREIMNNLLQPISSSGYSLKRKKTVKHPFARMSKKNRHGGIFQHILQVITGKDEYTGKDLNDYLLRHQPNETLESTVVSINNPRICERCFNALLIQSNSSLKSDENESSCKEIEKIISTCIARKSIAAALEHFPCEENHEKLYCCILESLQHQVRQLLLEHDVNLGKLSTFFIFSLIQSLRRTVKILDRNPETNLRMLKTLYKFFYVPTNKWFGTAFLNSLCGLIQSGVTRGENFDTFLRSIMSFINDNPTNFRENGAWREAEKNLKKELFDISHRGSVAYWYLWPEYDKPALPPAKEAILAEKQRLITFVELLQLNLLVTDKVGQSKKLVDWFLEETHARWYRGERIKAHMMATLLFYLIEYAAESECRKRELLAQGLNLDIRTLTWLDYIKSALSPEFNCQTDFKENLLPEAFLQGLHGEWTVIRNPSAVLERTKHDDVLYPPILYVICDVGVHLDEGVKYPCNSSKLFKLIREYFKDECTFDAWLAYVLRYAMFHIKDETYARKLMHLIVKAGIKRKWIRNCLSRPRSQWFFDFIMEDSKENRDDGESIKNIAKSSAHFSDNWLKVNGKRI